MYRNHDCIGGEVYSKMCATHWNKVTSSTVFGELHCESDICVQLSMANSMLNSKHWLCTFQDWLILCPWHPLYLLCLPCTPFVPTVPHYNLIDWNCLWSIRLSIEWNSIGLGGPAHGKVTKTVHKTRPVGEGLGGGRMGSPGVGWQSRGGGGRGYRSDTVCLNTDNSKFHLIESFF